MFDGIEWL